MQKAWHLLSPLVICVIVGLGCSSARLVTDVTMVEKSAADAVASHQEASGREPLAQLMQTTVRSPKLTKRFNLEIYHTMDTTAFYTGGFVGMGSFKGLLTGSHLQFILPGDKQYYDGPLSGFVEPDLSRYEYVVARLRELLSGNLICDPSDTAVGDRCDMWDQDFYVKGGRIVEVVFRSMVDSINIEVGLYKFRNEFPYYQIRRVKVENSENGASIKLQLIEQRYGPIPEIKFRLPNFAGWDRIDYFELE